MDIFNGKSCLSIFHFQKLEIVRRIDNFAPYLIGKN